MTKRLALNTLLAAGIAATLAPVPLTAQDAPAKPAAEDAKLPTPAEVVDRFIEVTGGKDAYLAHKFRTTSGYFEMPAMGMKGPMVVRQAAPNLMSASIELPGMGAMTTGFNGTTGWSINPMQGPMIMEGKQLDQMRREADFFGSVDMLKNFKESRVVGVADFKGEACHQLKLTSEDGITNVYFSVDTGLMVGRKSVEASPMGEVASVMTISDYKDFGGVLTATRQTIEAMGQTQVMVTESVTYDEIEADAFALPKVIQTLVEAGKGSESTEEPAKDEDPDAAGS